MDFSFLKDMKWNEPISTEESNNHAIFGIASENNAMDIKCNENDYDSIFSSFDSQHHMRTAIWYHVFDTFQQKYCRQTLDTYCFHKNTDYDGKEIETKIVNLLKRKHGFHDNDINIYMFNIHLIPTALHKETRYKPNDFQLLFIYKKISFEMKYFYGNNSLDIVNNKNYKIFKFNDLILQTTHLYDIINHHITNNKIVCDSLFCQKYIGFNVKLLVEGYIKLSLKYHANKQNVNNDLVIIIIGYYVDNKKLNIHSTLFSLGIKQNEKLILYKNKNYKYSEYDKIDKEENIMIYVENLCKSSNGRLGSLNNDFGVGEQKELIINVLDTVNGVREKIRNILGVDLTFHHHLMFKGFLLDTEYDESLGERKIIDSGVLHKDIIQIIYRMHIGS